MARSNARASGLAGSPATTARQLLTFSRRQMMQVKPLHLNELLADLLKMLRRLLSEQIELVVQGQAGPLWIEADARMVEPVMMHVCVNARDAMPQGGRLTIKTESIQIEASAAQTRPSAQPGTFVCLTVADTGCGIDEATQARMFEPFFTTKDIGKGTGLGLATAYGIVRQHSGWIEVDRKSCRGRGEILVVAGPFK